MPHENVLTDDARIAAILRQARRVAVLGIKPESRAGEAGHYVPAFLARQGVEVARAGILVVQDRCLMAEWRRLVG
jgi:predicted CoA-binding protein